MLSHFDRVKVKLIEDDALLTLSVAETLEAAGYAVQSFHSLVQFREQCNCSEDALYLVDLRLGNESGLEAMEWILLHNPFHIITITTSYGSIQTGAEAVKQGAFDVLEKPFTASDLLRKMEEASQELHTRAKKREDYRRFQRTMQILSFGEKKVFQYMLSGTANKVIASELDVSLRTVEMRRSKILKAFGVQSVPELVSLYCTLSNARGLGDELLLQHVM